MQEDGKPPHLEFALDLLSFSGEEDQSYLDGLRQRWGSLDQPSLLHMLEGSIGDHRLFAILALGALRTPEARQVLLPVLDGPNRLERWAAAISLGQVGAKEAQSILCDMLTYDLPEDVQSVEHKYGTSDWLYENWRGYAPILLGQLGDPAVVPALRSALSQVIGLLDQRQFALQDTLGPLGTAGDRRYFLRYEDDIIYALGRLHAYGSLVGLPAAEEYWDLWRVHVVMGSLHGRYPWHVVKEFTSNRQVDTHIRELLSQQYGLMPQEQDQALAKYAQAKLLTLHDICDQEIAKERGTLI